LAASLHAGKAQRDAPDPQPPLINGSDTSFSLPFVLTYPGNARPTGATFMPA